jgi:hypothetical protein
MGWVENAIRQRMPVSLGVDHSRETPIEAGSADPVLNDGVISQLERLGTLRDTGVITADEFETEKRRILGEKTTLPRTGE